MGFMSGGLGFASGIGSFIGGAAAKENQILDEQRHNSRIDDLMWEEKFQHGANEYEKEKKNADLSNQQFSSLIDAAGGDQRKAHAAMLQVMSDPKSFTTVFNGLMNDPTRGQNNSGYTSPLPGIFNSGVQSKLGNLQNMYSNASPQAQRTMQMPGSDYSTPQSSPSGTPGGQPQQQPPIQQQPTGGGVAGADGGGGGGDSQVASNASTPFSLGAPNKLATHEILKPDQFGGDMDAYQRYIKSVNASPNDPSRWDFSGVRSQGKLDPLIQSQIMEANKNLQYMTPEDRAAWGASIQEANRTGDVSKLRMDLVPSSDTISQQQAARATGIELGKKYADGINKRVEGLNIVQKSYGAANQMLNMVQSGQLNASAWQPFFDTITRDASAAGIDLRNMGFPGNKIENITQFKKFLADLTFDQIPNYHLGRWTNREFSLLQESLPSLDTNPSTVAKVGLLFRSAAQRELTMLPQEQAILTKNGTTNVPDPKDIGRAMYMSSQSKADTTLPYTELDQNANPATNRAIIDALKPGQWFEDPINKRMGYKLADGSVRMMPK